MACDVTPRSNAGVWLFAALLFLAPLLYVIIANRQLTAANNGLGKQRQRKRRSSQPALINWTIR